MLLRRSALSPPFICKLPDPLEAILEHPDLDLRIRAVAVTRGDCAFGKFKGTYLGIEKTYTSYSEHEYLKLDVIKLQAPDGKVAYAIQDHGFDI